MNKEKRKEYNKKYYEENKEKLKENVRKYYQENKKRKIEYERKRQREKWQNDPMYRMIMNQRRSVRRFLKANKYTKNISTEKLLGCSPEELREHLRKQYQQGMTDENYGEWHIDHIIPLSSAKSQEEVDKLFHYTNLQPLWAIDNLKKGDSTIT